MATGRSNNITRNAAVVILAGGKGTRMGRVDLPKVCFEIDGVPAINRIIETFKTVGFRNFFVVVGSMAEQVMETVAKVHPTVSFVYQAEQLGTGHAARLAADALEDANHKGPIILTAGDKHIESAAIRMLIEGYLRSRADIALLTTPKTKATLAASGRVFVDESGQALGIIERTDLARQAIIDELRQRLSHKDGLAGSTIAEIAEKHIPNPRKRGIAVGELLKMAQTNRKVSKAKLQQLLAARKYSLTIDGKNYTAREIEKRCNQFNPTLYLSSAEAFYLGTSMISNDNAQGEYYLTDIVKHLNSPAQDDRSERRFRIRTVPVGSEDLIRGFNSPDELLAIQDYTRGRRIRKGRRKLAAATTCRLGRTRYRSVQSWLKDFESPGPRLRRWLLEMYGKHEELHTSKIKEMRSVLKCYGRQFGFEQKVVLVRVPGRINMMGRHIDYQGGYNNFLALHCETMAVAGLRPDDVVMAANTEPKRFQSQEFSISELLGDFSWDDWLDFVNSQWVQNMLHSAQRDWVNYIQAAILRLQHEYNDLKIRGMNIAVHCGVPAGAGLGSNSTIVAAALQAAIGLNNLELTGQQFIDLCGQGEWFVRPGIRGGQLPVYLGQRGKITQVGYLPFRAERVTDAPADHQIILAASGVKENRTESAQRKSEEAIACYSLGLELLRLRCGQIAPMVEYVRDINPERLACQTSDIYRILQKIPEKMTRQELRRNLTRDHGEMLESIFGSHDDPGAYNLRSVLLFGAAECMRSRICMDYLASGDIEQFGRLAKISHDGDRVVRADDKGRYKPVSYDCSNRKLNGLISDLASEDPVRVLQGQLYMQPGRYGCSTEQMDRMVDIACSVEGVAGAQLAGAGLGGYVMIIARKDAFRDVRHALTERYYKPNGLRPVVVNYRTVAGAGLVQL